MRHIVELVDSGLALVPVPLGEKGPTHKGWNLQSECITSPDQLGLLTGKNIGLAHAFCSPTPTCAIDIDNFRASRRWLTTHGADLKASATASDATGIWSGKEQSLKLLYRLPTGSKPLPSTRVHSPEGQVILEFRCATQDGKTVQDLLPPSIHPSGTTYQWVGFGDPLFIPTIPLEFLNIWTGLLSNTSRVANRVFDADLCAFARPESPRQVAIIKDALSFISADCSYEIWRNIVWALLSTRWTCAEALAMKWSQSAPHRYTDTGFWGLVNSYMPQRGNPISVGTIYHFARLGGWGG
jgi:putative DNA primase/helicase